jgi:hypothetical protein
VSKTDPTTPPQTGTAPKTTAKGTNVVTLPAKTAKQRPSDKVVAFVKRHPVITVAGGIAVGVAVSALLPRRTSRKLLAKAVDLAEVAGATGAVFGKQAADTAHDVGISARKQGSVLVDKAEKVGDIAVSNFEKYGLAAVTAAGALGRATAKKATRFGDVAADTAHRFGDAAAERSVKLVHRAEDLAEDIRTRARSRH